jgi:succinate dehydrogenase / fumarate reductase membrane anchor subunit
MAVGVSERGSIRAGLGEWRVQRVTAVYVLFYIIAIVIRMLLAPVHSHADWLSLSSSLLFQVTTLLFIYSMLAHAWVGLKSVMLDYIKPWRLRFLLNILAAVALAGLGIWASLVVAI